VADRTPAEAKQEADILRPIADELHSINQAKPRGEWMVNMAHYDGKQYSAWDAARNKLTYEQKSSREQVRVVENRLMPAVNMRIATILQQVHVPQVMPPPDLTISERNRIETSNALVRWLSQPKQLNDNSNWELFLRSLALTGTAARIEWWDSHGGPVFADNGEPYAEGRHRTEVISPFDLFPQQNKIWDSDIQHVTVRRLSTVDEIKSMYGVTVDPDADMSDLGAYEWQLRNLGRPRFGAEATKVATYVYIYLERASEKYPEGREIHFTMKGKAAERMLYAGPNPNPGAELQVSILQEFPVGYGWSTSIASQLRMGNISYNSLLSSTIGYMKTILKIKVLAPLSSKVGQSNWTEENKNQVSVVPWDDSESPNPPQIIQNPPPPQGIFQTLSQLDKGRDDMMHQHASMRGQVQGQIRSQPAVQEVRETDLLPLQPLIDRFKDSVCAIHGWRLALARKYFTERRTAMVQDETNRWKAYDFHRGNLSTSTELYIPPEPVMPLSLDGRLNLLMKAQQLGLPPEAISASFSEIFHVDRIESVASLERNHREAQRQELEQLMQGVPMGVNAWDNDIYHMDEIDRFRNGDRALFDSLDGLVKAQIQDHWMAHDSQRIEKMLKAAQEQGLVQMAAQPPMPQGEQVPVSSGGEELPPEGAE